MKTSKDAPSRLPRAIALFLVLVAIVAPGFQTVVANTPVAVQDGGAAPDLPAMTLTPADLDQVGLTGFGTGWVNDDNPGWRTIGDAVADSPAANVVNGGLARIDQLNVDVSRAGWRRQYRQVMTHTNPAHPGSADVGVFSEVAEYADAAGADAALTLLMGAQEGGGGPMVGDRLEVARDLYPDDGTRLVLMFRDGAMLGTVTVFQYWPPDDDNDAMIGPAALELALRLQERIDDGLAQPGSGLADVALRLATLATPAGFEAYRRVNGETLADGDESAADFADREAYYGDAGAVYELRHEFAPPPGHTVTPFYLDRLFGFADEAAAAAWMEKVPDYVAEDVAGSNGTFTADQQTDAKTIGDASLTFATTDQSGEEVSYGYRIYLRVGADVARLSLDAPEELPIADTDALAAAQAACLQAGACPQAAPLPPDLAGLICPPASQTDVPGVVGGTVAFEAATIAGTDPGHTGANPGPGPNGKPQERWHFAALGGGDGPIVANGLLYFGSLDTGGETVNGTLHALDTATGTQRLCVPTGETVSAPAFAGGLVFTEANAIAGRHVQDFVVALTASTGAEKWRFYVGYTSGQLAVADGTVYVGTVFGTLYALDQSTGEVRWLFDIGEGSDTLGLPAIAGGLVYVAGGQTLHAIDAATGKERWHFTATTEDEELGAPSVANGVVYVAGKHALYAVDAKTGKKTWRFASESAGGNRLAVVDGVLYLGTGSASEPSGDAFLYALDAESGHKLWRFDTQGYVSTPAVAGDVVYVGTGVGRSDGKQEGAVRAIAAADGKELWNLPLDGIATTPVVIGGRVYVGAVTSSGDDAQQTLYAVDGTAHQ
jgi:outer membrane protein assembly factor BamB